MTYHLDLSGQKRALSTSSSIEPKGIVDDIPKKHNMYVHTQYV